MTTSTHNQIFTFIVKAVRGSQTFIFTGRAGEGFVSSDPAEAFIFSTREEADRKAVSLNRASALHCLEFEAVEIMTAGKSPHVMTDQELRSSRADLIRAKLQAEKLDLGAWVAHRQAQVIAEQRVRDDLGIKLSVQGDSFVMEGPTGRHEIAVSVTSDARLSAHWEGFKRETQKRVDKTASWSS